MMRKSTCSSHAIISRNERGRVWVNGVMVNVSTLAELTRGVIDISSQHEHATLLDASAHLDLLDRCGGLLARERWRTRPAGHFASRNATWPRLSVRDNERLQREDFLRFQLGEIEELDPQEGGESLRGERDRLAHATQLMTDRNVRMRSWGATLPCRRS